MTPKLLVIQAGHVGRMTGATGTNGLDGDPDEKEFNWAAANASSKMIRSFGIQTRVIQADVPDSAYKGDGFVAIHCDGSTSKSARGASVGYRNEPGKKFAALWKQAYYNAGWRGFRPDNYTKALAGYYGVRKAVGQGNVNAFVAECGFLTSPEDEKLLSLPAGPERFADALSAAVIVMLGVPQPQPGEEEEMLIIDSPGKPALVIGVGNVKRISSTQRSALRTIGCDAKQVDAATSDALYSLRD